MDVDVVWGEVGGNTQDTQTIKMVWEERQMAWESLVGFVCLVGEVTTHCWLRLRMLCCFFGLLPEKCCFLRGYKNKNSEKMQKTGRRFKLKERHWACENCVECRLWSRRVHVLFPGSGSLETWFKWNCFGCKGCNEIGTECIHGRHDQTKKKFWVCGRHVEVFEASIDFIVWLAADWFPRSVS